MFCVASSCKKIADPHRNRTGGNLSKSRYKHAQRHIF